MGTLSREQMGNASGIFNLMRNVGGSIGISMITTLVTRNAQVSQAALAPHMSAETLEFHHGKHHKAYVDKTNALAAEKGLDDKSLVELVRVAEGVAGSGHHFRVVQLPYNLAMPEAYAQPTQVIDGQRLSPIAAAPRLGVGVVASA